MVANATFRTGEVLLMGRALHAPWNEGTRVIARNLAQVASLLRPCHVMSLTHRSFQTPHSALRTPHSELPVRHIYTGARYGAVSDYANLRRVVAEARNVIQEGEVEVAHLIGAPLALAPWLKRRGIKVVSHITLCEQAYMGTLERARAALGWRLFDRWVDAYAVSSPALVEPLIARGVRADKIRTVPAPVDTVLYQPEGREHDRKTLGLAAGDLAVVYVGTLSPLRFPAETVKEGLGGAAKRLGRTLRFFAFAPSATHVYNKEWSEDVRRQLGDMDGVEINITLGDLSDEDKARWYRASDAMILPFAAPVAVEPPLTLLEAMSCGAAAVVTPHANRSQIIEHNRNGFSYETPQEMADALTQTLGRSGDELDAIKRNARDTVVRDYSFGSAATAVASLWSRLER